MLLHASHAANEGYSSAVICSEDTDVLIMSIAFQDEIGVPVFIKCGIRNRIKLVDVKKVASTLGRDVCKAVLGMHAYTGCDTVNAFAGKGKAQALKILMNYKESRDTFIKLGQDWDLSSTLMNNLEAVTCQKYTTKSTTTAINDLRYQLFCARKGEIESHQLPPCRDCLVKHAQRANYQAAIWRRCLQQDPQMPTPVGRGWKMELEDEREQLVVDWMEGKPAPDAILELLSCNCKKQCSSSRCVCVANGLRCTDMCRLQDCENQPSTEQEEDDDSSVNMEDDDDLEEDY
jgi:hypothetical protein